MKSKLSGASQPERQERRELHSPMTRLARPFGFPHHKPARLTACAWQQKLTFVTLQEAFGTVSQTHLQADSCSEM